MQGLKSVMAVAMIVGASAALGACGLHGTGGFGHHQKQVTHEPMKLGGADMIVEQPERR